MIKFLGDILKHVQKHIQKHVARKKNKEIEEERK